MDGGPAVASRCEAPGKRAKRGCQETQTAGTCEGFVPGALALCLLMFPSEARIGRMGCVSPDRSDQLAPFGERES